MHEELVIVKSKVEQLKKESKLMKAADDLNVSIDIDGNTISMDSESASNLMMVKDMILAYSRGFAPDIAKLLLNDDYSLIVMNMNDYTKSEKRQTQLKGRVIGRYGSIKERLGKLTMCSLRVYGKTISIIGQYEYANVAESGVDMLLKGMNFETVFKILNNEMKEAYINHGRNS
ncbi:hypothetical protein IHE51_01690 [Candidatus Parvarchaeota archaeon]|uniref:PNO1 second type I KH domain-containing protein n=1 Tax=Candidatus Acidifodinimicrobium mancum TaxID=2898728 RepID=A0A8T3V290_9ARCH|nr:hypothetical protein [Candidatus Acidifodinimicrobium mancum]MBE5729846.1 hypothetical protein [Candidatus Acidifodinimicrobium mancum]